MPRRFAERSEERTEHMHGGNGIRKSRPYRTMRQYHSRHLVKSIVEVEILVPELCVAIRYVHRMDGCDQTVFVWALVREE